MITEIEARKLKSIPEWVSMEKHFRECVQALNAVTDIAEEEDHDKVARGKKYAVKLIEHILEPFEIEDLTNENERNETLEKLGLSPEKGDQDGDFATM